MSTATHYPDGGFKAGYSWPQTALLLANKPGTVVQWQSFTAMSGGDLTNLGTDNDNGVMCECYFVGGEDHYTYAGGVAPRVTITDGTVSQLDITIKGDDTGGTGYHFYAYNGSSLTEIGSHTGGAPGAFTFTVSITSNAANYLDGSGHMWIVCCVDDFGGGDAGRKIVFVKVVDTYTVANVHLTLTADVTAFTIATPAVGLKATHRLPVSVTDFAITPQSVALKAAHKIAAAVTSYSISGQAVDLRAAHKVVATVTQYNISDKPVNLRVAHQIPAGITAYIVTEQAVNLRTAHRVPVTVTPFLVDGQAVQLKAAHHIVATVTSFLIQWFDVTLTKWMVPTRSPWKAPEVLVIGTITPIIEVQLPPSVITVGDLTHIIEVTE